jgi:hypothetical protein
MNFNAGVEFWSRLDSDSTHFWGLHWNRWPDLRPSLLAVSAQALVQWCCLELRPTRLLRSTGKIGPKRKWMARFSRNQQQKKAAEAAPLREIAAFGGDA